MSAIPIPDPVLEKTRNRAALKGETPDPLNIPAGCRFNSCCPRASDLCRRQEPLLTSRETGNMVACHHPLEAAAVPA